MSTPSLAFAIPGDIDTLTGGYVYDRRLLAELRAMGLDVAHCRLPGSFPFPAADDLALAGRLLHACPPGPLLIDGLAFAAMPAQLLADLPHRLVALVHHPLGLETGLSVRQAAQLIRSERAALAQAARVITTSATTADILATDFDVARDNIAIAEPGTDPAARATGSGRAEGPLLMAAGSIIPRKGYDVLMAALAAVAHLPWHLLLVGSPHRAPETAAALHADIAALGLAARITLRGELSLDEMAQAYAAADVFVMPSRYEGFGMVLAEAMARGLPIVASTGGAAARTVPDGAALKVPPGDAPALAAALARIIGDHGLRVRLAEASFAAGAGLQRWPQTARIVAQAVLP